jgi:hypothetical protein
MLQAKFSIEEAQARFLNNYRDYGFKDKSSMLRAAISHFQKEFELKRLINSADLYAEIYSEDKDLKELTEAAASGWPE